MQSISLDAAEAMTGISRRTLWRRVADGELTSTGKDARNRAVLALEGLQGWMQGYTGLVFSAQDLNRLCQADTGDAQAQVDLGAWLYTSPRAVPRVENSQPALYWLHLAAEQNHGDAMHWLATVAANTGTQQGHYESLMWLAKAAMQGHPIATAQLQALLDAVLT